MESVPMLRRPRWSATGWPRMSQRVSSRLWCIGSWHFSLIFTLSKPPSLDHLVGTQQDRFRNRESDGLSGLEVHDKFEFDRLLDRKLAGLGSLEHAVDVCCQPTPRIEDAGEIGHDPAVRDVIQISIHARKSMSCGKINNLPPIGDEVCIRLDNETAGAHGGPVR